jgi:hypothetical protein
MAEESTNEPVKGAESKSSNWWQTMPGVLTALAGIITAMAGLIAALHQAGLFAILAKPSASPVTVLPSAGDTHIQSPSAPPTSSNLPSNPNQQSSTLAAEMEATIPVEEGTATYKILSTQLAPLNAKNRFLKLMVRCTANNRYGVNFWSQSFRLIVDGAPRSPSTDFNGFAEAQSSKEGEVIFIIPIATTKATLQIGDLGKETTEIPLDLTVTKS